MQSYSTIIVQGNKVDFQPADVDATVLPKKTLNLKIAESLRLFFQYL